MIFRFIANLCFVITDKVMEKVFFAILKIEKMFDLKSLELLFTGHNNIVQYLIKHELKSNRSDITFIGKRQYIGYKDNNCCGIKVFKPASFILCFNYKYFSCFRIFIILLAIDDLIIGL